MLDKVTYALFQRAKKALQSDEGNFTPMIALALIGVFLLIALGLESWRLNSTSDFVNEAVRSSLISANVQNAETLYTGEQDMIGGSFTYDASTNTWSEPVDTTPVTDLLSSKLGLTQEGSDWISKVNGQENYKIKGFAVTESQPAASDGTPDSTKSLTITASFTLEIPYNAGGTVTKISVPMNVPVGTQGKF
ncbi:hypothetical protein [Ethanoligenens harbinense]|uniref:Uncharacterized protein n=1 Tax=Ethanoligenens harbinense (strain DSM 18485 / JCM 12961 / CGMCC 1.5033 / YUAN-3) TaxID=663278 RepID=E6U5T4_ETHHY|nr:hypothetical protein [Ethanoligenens harbinense]ADU27951.1 hypothetical protein Ethha_2456 [Ethanoligenens harbinense YUAN-3]AVQ96979.1 hypothetical protein CXQ68_12615 [Ethanoligenens harbinense YUAN-3]AYF39639.1 hypothetical protein CXP51_12510 [Ethanoligenens harbinense]AYF42467.1 hypothetical protein CN246_13065 [Ethanoligenens harbinense]QCN93220.1 hypothetical protein DRA42_12660 [Ethanoligenens harbinense]